MSDCAPQGDNNHAIRYRWLRKNLSRIVVSTCPVSCEDKLFISVREISVTEHFCETEPESVDRAIDAAIQRERDENES